MIIYPWLVGLAAAVGLALSGWLAPPDWERPSLEGGALLVLGSLLGGRLDYVLRHWPFYQGHLVEALNLGAGGLAWPGAALGGVSFLLAYTLLGRYAPGQLADYLLPLGAALGVAAWLGCWFAGCAYGPLTAGLALSAVDESGAVAMRFPLQLLAALLTLAGFGLAEWLRPRWRQPGGPALLAALVSLGVLFGVSFWQADPGRIWRGWRLDNWAALIYAAPLVLSLLYLLFVGSVDET